MKRIVVLLFVGLLFGPAIAQTNNSEHIISYNVDITVNKDRSIDVVEKIKVKALGYTIKRGIYREIPVTARDDNGTLQTYNLEIKAVLKDGLSEPFHVQGGSYDKTIYIGDADTYLTPGDYEYTIVYNMSGQVRFFEAYDELYWNVTGNFWQFVIGEASATVTLPTEAKILQSSAYTGGYGEQGSDATVTKLNDHTIKFATKKPLSPHSGLTIAIGWNKGVIPPPTAEELRAVAMRKYQGAIYGAFGVLIIFLYLFWAWKRVGVDPKGGAIIPRFEPPGGYSPAACRYVMRMGFDNKSFASALVSMAVKGYLNIDNTKKKYKLNKVATDETALSKGEKQVGKTLFTSNTTLEVDNDNHSKFSSAIYALENSLKNELAKANFSKNGKWMVPAIFMAVANVVIILVNTAYDVNLMVPLVIGSFFTLFAVLFTAAAVNSIRKASGWKAILSTVLSFLPFAIFVGAPLFILQQLELFDAKAILVFIPYLAVYIVMIVLIVVFFYLIKAPTVAGRKVMDEIEGLKMYMEVAEENRLNMLNPPKETPQLFEKLLPYAIALDVENEWGKRFESILAKAMESNEYNPTWYTGTRYTFMDTAALTSSLGRSFSSSVSSASVSPQSSSSSGSSGGGFSGGGGGGGGGGGW